MRGNRTYDFQNDLSSESLLRLPPFSPVASLPHWKRLKERCLGTILVFDVGISIEIKGLSLDMIEVSEG